MDFQSAAEAFGQALFDLETAATEAGVPDSVQTSLAALHQASRDAFQATDEAGLGLDWDAIAAPFNPPAGKDGVHTDGGVKTKPGS